MDYCNGACMDCPSPSDGLLQSLLLFFLIGVLGAFMYRSPQALLRNTGAVLVGFTTLIAIVLGIGPNHGLVRPGRSCNLFDLAPSDYYPDLHVVWGKRLFAGLLCAAIYGILRRPVSRPESVRE